MTKSGTVIDWKKKSSRDKEVAKIVQDAESYKYIASLTNSKGSKYE